MSTVLERNFQQADEWYQRWSQLAESQNYINAAANALKEVDFTRQRDIWVFNCSDGPSAYGMLGAIGQQTNPISVTLSDAAEYAAHACRDYVARCLPYLTVTALPLLTEDVARHVRATGGQVDTFVSFEPVGSLPAAFIDIFEILPHAGKIVIAARTPLSLGVQGLKEASKRLGLWKTEQFQTHSSNNRTGLAVSLTKL